MKNYWKITAVVFIILVFFSGCKTTKMNITVEDYLDLGKNLLKELPDTIDGRKVILEGILGNSIRLWNLDRMPKRPDSISPKELSSILRKHKLVLVPDTFTQFVFHVQIDTNILYKNRLYRDDPTYDMNCSPYSGYLPDIMGRIKGAYNSIYEYQLDVVKLIMEDSTTYKMTNKYNIFIDRQHVIRYGANVFGMSCFYNKYGIRLIRTPDQDEKIPVYYVRFKFEEEYMYPKKKRKPSPKTP
ncbi:MAG: hypothetical protein R2798_12995 [Chitinophagales bacterium]|nr:hypothetical protein [Bacteroidota bacterium]